jgi:OOP family OmpA-OmpF porin
MKQFFLALFLFTISIGFGQVHFSVSGNVTDKGSKPIAHAYVNMIGSDGTYVRSNTDSVGHYSFDSTQVKSNTSYILNAEPNSDIYLASLKTNITTVGLTASRVFTADFALDKLIRCGPLPRVLFGFKKTELTQGTKDTALKYLVKMLQDNPGLKIELDAHASNDEGSSEQKTALSQARAQACIDYLISQGIDSLRFVGKG